MIPFFRFLVLVALGLSAGARVGGAAQPLIIPGVVPAGDLRSATAFHSVVFYFSPRPAVPAMAAARDLFAARFPGVPVAKRGEAMPPPPYLFIETEVAPLKNYPVPSVASLKYSGRGLSATEAAAVQDTREALRIGMVVPRDEVWRTGRKFTELVLEVAEQTSALIYDSATRELFTRAAWQQRRLARWTEGEIPLMADQFTIHTYRVAETNYLRAITLGMEKFALPDLVVQELVASQDRTAGNLLSLGAQMLAENPVVVAPGDVRWRLRDLKNPVARETQRKNLFAGATEEAWLVLLEGKLEQGDADNPLVELGFGHGEGRSADEQRQSILSAIWGSEESLVSTTHDAELLAASERARKKLPELQQVFAQGLAPGERLLLKAPFAREEGEGWEWMWVEVLQWPAKGPVAGALMNTPFYIKSLRAGARVSVKPEEVFDYIFYRAGGVEEGNETGKILARQKK